MRVMTMPAVILAAGRATRLRPFTDHLPKSLLEIAGSAMLERSLRSLMAAGVREVVIVTGFEREKVHAAVARWNLDLQVIYVNNPDFETTNNAYSLELAADAVGARPFILLDSDLVYDGEIVRDLIARGDSCLALRRAPDLGAEEVKVAHTFDHRVTGIGKEVALDQSEGESVGIEVFTAEASAHLFATLRERIHGQGLRNEYYEASFQQMIEEGAVMTAVDIAPYRAMEVDTPADLSLAAETFGAVTTRLPWTVPAQPGRPIAS
jgi:choline kinase